MNADLKTSFFSLLSTGIFISQSSVERNAAQRWAEARLGRSLKTKGEIDDQLAAFVAAGLLAKSERRFWKGRYVVTPYLDLTAEGRALNLEWMRANLDRLPAFTRKQIEAGH